MLIRLLIIVFSTSMACLIVAMAINGSHNPFAIFPIAHIVVGFGLILSVPSVIYGYLKGSILWAEGVRTYKPYLQTAVKASLINAAALIILTGIPFLMKDWIIVSLVYLSAFACGGVIASAISFTLMQSVEKNNLSGK